MRKIFLFVFLAFIFINLTNLASSADTISPIKVSTCGQLPQLDATVAWENVTSVQLPDKSINNFGQFMDKNGPYFNFTFCNTSQLGTYYVNGYDNNSISWKYDFKVTANGQALETSNSLLYVIVLVISFVFFVIAIWGGLALPYQNKRDQMTGYILAVENLKYLKMFCWAIAYLMVLIMSYFGWIISQMFLYIDFLGNIFKFAFYALAYSTLPLFIIGMYIAIANWIRDSNISDQLSRGLRING